MLFKTIVQVSYASSFVNFAWSLSPCSACRFLRNSKCVPVHMYRQMIPPDEGNLVRNNHIPLALVTVFWCNARFISEGSARSTILRHKSVLAGLESQRRVSIYQISQNLCLAPSPLTDGVSQEASGVTIAKQRPSEHNVYFILLECICT